MNLLIRDGNVRRLVRSLTPRRMAWLQIPLLIFGIILSSAFLEGCSKRKKRKGNPGDATPGDVTSGDASAQDPSNPAVPATIPKVNVGNLRETNKEIAIDAQTSDAVKWEWEQLAGPGTLTFQSPNSEDTLLSADRDGFYWIRLTVTSADGSTAFDDFEMLWDTQAPTLRLSPEIRAFHAISVDGSVSSDATSIEWTQLSGPGQMIFGSAQSSATTLSADADGVYLLRLTVADKLGNATFAEMTFIWETGVPAVSLGQDIMTNKEFGLDAATAEAAAFSWAQVSGPGTLVFSTPTAEDTNIRASADGNYVLRLTITTAGGQTASDEINFTWDTTPPSINVGQDMSRKYRATIDALTSEAASFRWSQKSGPGRVIFSAGTSEDTALIVDQAGDYEIELSVSDQAGNVASDRVIINFEYDIRVFAKAVSSGGSHSCAILDDSSVACWGYNYEQELGYGDANRFGEGSDRYAPPSFPINIGSGQSAIAISVNYSHSCAILSDGNVKCWGQNASGQLGYGDASRRSVPPAAPLNLGEGRKAQQIATGFAHSCAILDDQSVKCWGLNSSGQLGYGDFLSRTAPPAETLNLGGGRTAKALSLGAYHSCALLDDDSVKCWGSNINGELGLGDKNYRNRPQDSAVVLAAPARAISAGAFHNCAVLQSGDIQCWGRNQSGQLGYGDTSERILPDATFVSLGVGRSATSVTAGLIHSCALMEDKSVQCWGGNDEGQLGYGDLVNRPASPESPVPLGDGRTIKAISAGRLHTCAVLDDDTLKCWGSNSYGQLGNGKIVDGTLPPPTVIGYGD